MLSIDVDWNQIWFNLSHLGIAYVLALPVAMDREADSRSAGLRNVRLSLFFRLVTLPEDSSDAGRYLSGADLGRLLCSTP